MSFVVFYDCNLNVLIYLKISTFENYVVHFLLSQADTGGVGECEGGGEVGGGGGAPIFSSKYVFFSEQLALSATATTTTMTIQYYR